MNRLLLSLLVCVSLCANASEIEDPVNAALVMHAVDYVQTLSISESCHTTGEFYETNPILGRCPSKEQVTMYFAATGVALYALHAALPDEYKKYLSYVWLTVETGAVGNNLKIGVKFRF